MGKRGRTGVDGSGSIADSILSLYDLCGCFAVDNDRERPRRTLVRALRKLAGLLDQIGSQESRASSTAVTPLVQVEQVLRELRRDLVPSAVAANEFDSEQSLLLRRDLEVAASSSWHLDLDFVRWSRVLLGFSLAAALMQQLGEERSSIRDLEEIFDTMFLVDREGPRSDRVIRFIKDTITTLERKCLLENRRYLEEMEGLVDERQDQSINAWQCPSPVLMTGTRFGARRQRERSHNCVLGESTLEDAVVRFLEAQVHDLSPVTALLVVGDNGSGKTHLCDKIEQYAKAARCAAVVRPNVPLDFQGRTVGAAEDRVVSMFAACAAHDGKTVLVVDDGDELLGSATNGDSPPTMRCKQAFLASLDCLQESLLPDSAVLLLCTAKDESTASVNWFDRTFHLDLPSEEARTEFLREVLGIPKLHNDETSVESQRLRDLLACVVESTAGRSYAEMMQFCRHALLVDSDAESSKQSALDGLEHLKARLSQLTPASLRDSVLDSYVDLRVLGSHDLTSAVKAGDFDLDEEFPFRGSAAASAWNDLIASIVIPLCRSKELNDLLDCSGSGSRRVLAGGLLLTGPPGSGKSALALHCAKYAALISPSIKLLEVSCTSMIHKELGGSERAVHQLFEAARRASPCILVLDGIENVAAVRGNDPTTEGTLDRVLSTLLVELDGIDDFAESGTYSIAVIGITSDERWIDPAVKRPGRLQKAARLALDWI